MIRNSAFIVAVLLASPALAQPPASRWESARPVAKEAKCVEKVSADPDLDAALKALTFEIAGQPRGLREVRLEGLTTLKAEDIWKLLGGAPETPDPLRATTIVRRLVGSGLFAQVLPVLDVQGDGVVLRVRLTEHPRLTRVVFEGLTEARPQGLLHALLKRPNDGGKKCGDQPPPREWLARVSGDVVYPGVVWKGLRPGVERVIERLFDDGYQMSTVSGELSPDGTLTLRIDEGRLEAIEIRGVSPAIEADVRRRLELPPGAIFDSGELGGALERIRDTFPFLDRDRRPQSTRRRPRIVEVAGPEGAREYRLVEAERDQEKGWYTVDGHRLVLYLVARRGELRVDPSEFLRHTPDTGNAPGLELRARWWDPDNRVHLTVDVGGNVNINRARQVVTPQGTSKRWRFDWMVGPKVQIPALHLAEVGAQVYSRVDTEDRWRIDRVDSYLYSMLFYRPGSDYFQRTGITAFVTTHLLERLTAGVAYRRDRYLSLETPGKVWTLFNNDEAPLFTPPITSGTMASLLLRLEYSSKPEPAHKVGRTLRDPERTIVRYDNAYWWSDFHTVNTVEIADPGLAGDPQFKFVKLVSDSAVFLRQRSPTKGLKVRFRAAGRLGGALPLQREEALGGWSALRGYAFKEFKGNFSLLSTVEYRFHVVSAWVDVGSVRAASGFGTPHTGVGLAGNIGDGAALTLAWRADDQAEWTPEVRFFFNRTF